MSAFIWALGGALAGALGFWVLNRIQSQKLEKYKNDLGQAAGEALKQAQESFLTLAETRLKSEANQQQAQLNLAKKEVEGLIKPLSEVLQQYKKELHENETKRAHDQGGLDRMLKMIIESNAQLKNETQNLVNALKRPTVRGRWGELQLKRVVELAGMSAHCDFHEQSNVDSDEGRLRPDMVIRLPGQRTIIVDSKAILSAYLEAESATDEKLRKDALARHALSIKTRIQDLSRKSYWEQFERAPDFVVMFIPGEAFFSAALETQPDLVEYGFNQKVVLATPTTLMALLRAVAYGWRQEQLTENAKQVSELATRVYQGLSVWTSHLASVGLSIDRAAKAFNQSVGSLERTVMPPLRKLKEHGISSKDEVTKLEPVETALRELAQGVEPNS